MPILGLGLEMSETLPIQQAKTFLKTADVILMGHSFQQDQGLDSQWQEDVKEPTHFS